jgi:hypothetical protein
MTAITRATTTNAMPQRRRAKRPANGGLACVLISLAVALGGAALVAPTPGLATVITIDQPTSPPPSAAVTAQNPAGALNTKIGAGVPNTGGVVPDTPSTPTAGTAVEPAPAVAPTTNAQLAAMAMATTNTELIAIAMLGPTSRVRVVLIGASETGADALAKARKDQSADVDRLQAAINANAMFKADLAAKNLDVAKILAAEVSTDGVLIVYSMA